MDKKMKFVMTAVALAAVFVSAGVLYSKLSESGGITRGPVVRPAPSAAISADAAVPPSAMEGGGSPSVKEDEADVKSGEVTVTKENFDSEVIRAKGTVLIDFWAEWCGPCRKLAPIISEIAGECGGRVKVCKVNVDEQPELAARFRISAIPALIVMKNGEVANRAVGYMGKEEVMSLIE